MPAGGGGARAAASDAACKEGDFECPLCAWDGGCRLGVAVAFDDAELLPAFPFPLCTLLPVPAGTSGGTGALLAAYWGLVLGVLLADPTAAAALKAPLVVLAFCAGVCRPANAVAAPSRAALCELVVVVVS